MEPPMLRITSDEINCLVYAYLVDSGFKHTAFSLCMEGRLEDSTNFSKHIPRGELIDLLSKSLLYREVESHWKEDNLSANCKIGFSLLEPHICSLEPPRGKNAPVQPVYTQLARAGNGDAKRKGDPLSAGPAGKRAKLEPNAKPTRIQGPADRETDPRSVLVLPGHESEVFVCAFNPVNPSILVTGSKDAAVNLWDLPPPPPASSPDFAQPPPNGPRNLEYFGSAEQGDLTSLDWSPDGTFVAMGSFDSVLRICTSTGDLYFSHTQHQASIFAVRFSGDGKWLLSASLDGTTCLWDVARREMHTQYRVHKDCCLDVDWLSDSVFASCSADGTIQMMEIGNLEPIRKLIGHTGEINQIKFNPARTRLASGADDHTARIWTLSQPDDEPIVLSGHTHSVNMVSWVPLASPGTNELFMTASFDNTARLWDAITGACLHIFADHKRPVYALKCNTSGQLVATGSGDGWLHIYDIKTRELQWSWFAGLDKPGIFEIDWITQLEKGVDRIALALECRAVAVVDLLKVPALQAKSS
ncbi:hypothetical protein MKEN_00251900 [Mycena kentingensis (nom. inval.)]|nr:hypothetical protein MKEN_00251900 [Mycena kentingensis (nom. inval.)]